GPEAFPSTDGFCGVVVDGGAGEVRNHNVIGYWGEGRQISIFGLLGQERRVEHEVGGGAGFVVEKIRKALLQLGDRRGKTRPFFGNCGKINLLEGYLRRCCCRRGGVFDGLEWQRG